MLVEELLPLAVLVVGGIAIIFVALRRGRRDRRLWEPTFENLHLLCVECEHELLEHPANLGGRCQAKRALSGDRQRAEPCNCRLSRRRAFQTALTRFELVARKEMLPE